MQGTVSKATGLLLSDILQLLCQTGQTGCLHLSVPGSPPAATLNLAAGAILNATYGEKKEAVAIIDMLNAPTWEFELVPQIEDPEGRLHEPLSALLLRGVVHVDTLNGSRRPDHVEWRPQLLEYTIEKSGVHGGFSEEDGRVLAEDLDFIQTAAHLFATRLGEHSVREMAISEPGQSLAFSFGSEKIHAVAGINSDLETALARVRSLSSGQVQGS